MCGNKAISGLGVDFSSNVQSYLDHQLQYDHEKQWIIIFRSKYPPSFIKKRNEHLRCWGLQLTMTAFEQLEKQTRLKEKLNKSSQRSAALSILLLSQPYLAERPERKQEAPEGRQITQQ